MHPINRFLKSLTHWCLCVLSLCAAVRSSEGQTVSATSNTPASVFLLPALPSFALTTDASSVQWTVTDFWEKTVASGTLATPGATATLSFDPGALGWFSIRLVPVKNGVPGSAVVVTAALLSQPDPAAPETPFGIATHFAQGWDLSLMPLISKAGLRRLRDENYWNEIESTAQNKYEFPGRFTEYMKAAQAHGIEPLMALTFSNSLYDGGNSPYTDAGRSGYANYAKEVVRRYGSQIKEVEVWNEYNGSFISGPATATRAASYTAMLKKTYETLHLAPNPSLKIGGGAAVLVPLPWFESLFQAGALDYLDALVVHPYRGVPEGVETEIAALKALTRQYNNGVEKPVWVTEFATDAPEPGRQSMARYLVRMATLLRSEGVERISWYLLKDEHSFVRGLLYADNSPFGKNAPTSAYPAFSTLIKTLADAAIVRRETTDLRTRIYFFTKDGAQLRVAWSTSGTARVAFSTSQPLVVTDLMGNSRTVAPVAGAVALTLTDDPIYVAGEVTGVQEMGRDVLLTDSAANYSEVQGSGNGTSLYGYEVNSTPNPPFELFTLRPTDYGSRWMSSHAFAQLRIDNAHPSVSGSNPVTTIRRWLSDVAGPVRIQGFAVRTAEGGDGTGIAIRVDGTLIHTRLVGPSKDDVATFSVRANLRLGSRVDFMVTPGPAANMNFDAIDYAFQISQPFATGDPAGAFTADPDGDGLSNLLEAALGSDSREADGAKVAPLLSVKKRADQLDYLHLSYRTLRAPGGITYQVLVSSDLLTWQAAPGTSVFVRDEPDGTRVLEYQDTQAITAPGQRFLRLQATQPAAD